VEATGQSQGVLAGRGIWALTASQGRSGHFPHGVKVERTSAVSGGSRPSNGHTEQPSLTLCRPSIGRSRENSHLQRPSKTRVRRSRTQGLPRYRMPSAALSCGDQRHPMPSTATGSRERVRHVIRKQGLPGPPSRWHWPEPFSLLTHLRSHTLRLQHRANRARRTSPTLSAWTRSSTASPP
jgi:hypothetical protein